MSRLYIGNLPFSINDEALAKFINTCNVKASKSNVMSRGERSLGFGFVELPTADKDAANKAIEALNGKEIEGRKIKVEVAREEGAKTERKPRTFAPRQPRAPRTSAPRTKIPAPTSGSALHVGNLPFAATADDLKNIFDGFTLKSSTIAMRDGRSKGFGFVEFNSQEEAKKAMESVEGTQVEGRIIKLEFKRPETSRTNIVRPARAQNSNTAVSTSTSSAPKKVSTRPPRKPRVPLNERVKSKCTIHIGNLAFAATEEDVKAAMTKFTPKTVTIPKKGNGQSKGFAFVEFETEAQTTAALAINDVEIKGRNVKADIAFVPIPPTPVAEKK